MSRLHSDYGAAQQRNMTSYWTNDGSKIFWVDDLETSRIQGIEFETYENMFGPMDFHGLRLNKEQFEKIKGKGGIIGTNLRSENVKIAMKLLENGEQV